MAGEVEGLHLGLLSVLVTLLELEHLGSQLLVLLLHLLHLLDSDLVGFGAWDLVQTLLLDGRSVPLAQDLRGKCALLHLFVFHLLSCLLDSSDHAFVFTAMLVRHIFTVFVYFGSKAILLLFGVAVAFMGVRLALKST